MGVYQRKDSQYWWIDYLCGGRRIRESSGTKNRREALRLLEARRTDVRRGKFDVASLRTPPLFGEFAGNDYLDYAKANKRSWDRDRQMIDHLSRFFEGQRLDQIEPHDVERYKMFRLKEGAKPATVNREVALLKHIFNCAIDWKKVAANPVRKVRFLKVPDCPKRILSPSEEERLIAAAPQNLKPIIMLGLNTGMRRGEILNLKWQDVKLAKRVISVVQAKTGKVKYIPLNETALKILLNLDRRGEYIFRNRDGSPYDSLYRGFQGAVKRAGIARCSFKDLRDTFATRLVEKGVDLVTVKELLGHSNIQTTMIYAHPSPEHKKKAVGVLDQGEHVTFSVTVGDSNS